MHRSLAVAKLQFRRQEERTVGRSKVVRKFLPVVETFSLQKFKNGDTCSPFLSICRANAISCALPREMLKNADYTTFRQTEGLEFSLKSFFHTVTKRHFSRQAEWNARCRANRLALRHMHLSADKNGQTALVCPLYFYSPQPGQSEQSPHSVPSAALRSS